MRQVKVMILAEGDLPGVLREYPAHGNQSRRQLILWRNSLIAGR